MRRFLALRALSVVLLVLIPAVAGFAYSYCEAIPTHANRSTHVLMCEVPYEYGTCLRSDLVGLSNDGAMHQARRAAPVSACQMAQSSAPFLFLRSPEPSAVAGMLAGLVGLVGIFAHRRRSSFTTNSASQQSSRFSPSFWHQGW